MTHDLSKLIVCSSTGEFLNKWIFPSDVKYDVNLLGAFFASSSVYPDNSIWLFEDSNGRVVLDSRFFPASVYLNDFEIY